MPDYLKPIGEQELKTYLAEREGEIRLGQKVKTADLPLTKENLAAVNARFVLLGIPEDIGVRANLGKAGTAGFWPEFLKVFLNIQSNHFLTGENILLAGEVICQDLLQAAKGKQPAELYALVNELDKRVEAVLNEIFAAGKIPIVIGGGHNNAYPIIKAAAVNLGKKINVINIDPHADMRDTNGRHSGNGFSCAYEEGYMDSYLQLGLHENYNNNHIMQRYAGHKTQLQYLSFDDYLKGKWTLENLKTALGKFAGTPTGFELDTDSIEHFPSSAQSPTGLSTNDARRMVMMVAQEVKPLYFHLPEAIPATTPFNSMKMATYLVTDFIKNYDFR